MHAHSPVHAVLMLITVTLRNSPAKHVIRQLQKPAEVPCV